MEEITIEETKMAISFISDILAEIKPTKGRVDEIVAPGMVPVNVSEEKIEMGLNFFQKSFYRHIVISITEIKTTEEIGLLT